MTGRLAPNELEQLHHMARASTVIGSTLEIWPGSEERTCEALM
jgi:hypothetical protein